MYVSVCVSVPVLHVYICSGDSGRKIVMFFLHNKTLVMPNAANRLTALLDMIQYYNTYNTYNIFSIV